MLNNLAYQEGCKELKVMALEWLEGVKSNSNDDTFRMFLAKVKESEHSMYEMEEIDFMSLQNTDGGFGILKGYDSDVIDTVLAVESMLESDKYHQQEIKKAMKYLLSSQNEDGGFSYWKNESNTYLTAYVYKVTLSYLNAHTSSSVKSMLEKCEAYLLNNEQNELLWGIEENTIRNSLMCSVALVSNDEDTINRISIISDKLSENGSMYGDVELTSLYVSLINEYEIVTGNESFNHAKIKELKVNADKERIGAYTEVTFTVNVLGMSDEQKLVAVVSGEDGYSCTLEESDENIFVWNTENNMGTFEVLVAVMNKTDGSIVTSKTKSIDVSESFEVKAVTCNVSPKVYKIDSGKNIKIETSALVLSNVNKEVIAEVSIKNETGEILYSDSRKNIGGCDYKEMIFDEFTYLPEITESALLTVITQIKVDDRVFKSRTDYIKAYILGDENRIDIDYSTESNYMDITMENLLVNFTLSGKGLSETIKRKPMDIMIILDDSGSLSKEDFLRAQDAARTLVEYMHQRTEQL